ncbi:MAG: hypothetical protein U5K73_00680 [Halofilum sp. (in: g-proteobacteria)]|nr:hypothetical protein [Halofilum sp. (in: g-proteobacteria)]
MKLIRKRSGVPSSEGMPATVGARAGMDRREFLRRSGLSPSAGPPWPPACPPP